MGVEHSTKRPSFDAKGEVNFDHFQILRAIGKGSFGKVCIVQKRDTRRMYAMKYMNKNVCAEKGAIRNVLQEMDLLRHLDHPFLVNLWFTFQDEEDMFMVVDLLLGGDLRYHIQHDVRFSESRVKLYICEIGLALDYLRKQNVLHRDIKPDNILLDEDGHVHITDFNIATRLEEGELATSLSGTKPYMAPEIFACALDDVTGYSFPVDWWSLGVCAYEMLRGKRPFEIHSGTSNADVVHMLKSTTTPYLGSIDSGMADLVRKLMTYDPSKRINNLKSLQNQPYLQDMNFDLVLAGKIKPSFIPPKDHLNCDPTYELEEMIIESKPLHKKKKRLAKRNSKREKEQSVDGQQEVDPVQECLDNLDKQFKNYNRERDFVQSSPSSQTQDSTQPTNDLTAAPSSHSPSDVSHREISTQSQTSNQTSAALHRTPVSETACRT